MSDYVKLAIGESTTFKVKSVEVNREGKWPDYHFADADSAKIIVAPQAAMDRQLQRLTMSPVELSGHYITIERAPNKEDAKKSWWNLALANKSDVNAPPSKRLTEATAKAPDSRSAGQREFDAAVPLEDEKLAHDRQIPLPDSEDGAVTTAELLSANMERKFTEYTALMRKVAAVHAEIGAQYEAPFDLSSIQATTFSIWKN